METKLLSYLTTQDEQTIQALLEELFYLNNPTIPNSCSEWYNGREYTPPKNEYCDHMRPDIGNLIMSAIDVLYGTNNAGDSVTWLAVLENRYGAENVEPMTKIGSYNKVTDSASHLKWYGWFSYYLNRGFPIFRGAETIEAINIRVDALEAIFSKYEKMTTWAYYCRMLERLQGKWDWYNS